MYMYFFSASEKTPMMPPPSYSDVTSEKQWEVENLNQLSRQVVDLTLKDVASPQNQGDTFPVGLRPWWCPRAPSSTSRQRSSEKLRTIL